MDDIKISKFRLGSDTALSKESPIDFNKFRVLDTKSNDYYIKQNQINAIGINTLKDDLIKVNNGIQSAYNKWQTKEKMNNTKSLIKSMYTRLTSLQNFCKTNGIADGEKELSEIVGVYKSTLDDWDDLTLHYNKFKTADDYNKSNLQIKKINDEYKRAKNDNVDIVQSEFNAWQKELEKILNRKEWLSNDEWRQNNDGNYAIPYSGTNIPEVFAGKTLSQAKEIVKNKKAYLEKVIKIQQDEKYSKLVESGEGEKGYKKWLKYAQNTNDLKYNKPIKKRTPFVTGKPIRAVSDNIVMNKMLDNSYARPKDDWTLEELYQFGARWDEENPSIAYNYATEVNNDKALMQKNKAKQKAADFATRNFATGTLATIGGILAKTLAIADFMDDFTDKAAYRDAIVEEPNLTPFEWATASTDAISEKLNKKGTLNKNIPVIGGKGWGDLYALGENIAQSAVLTATGGPLITAISFFGQGAADAVNDATERGATIDEALSYGTIVGAAEMVSEYIGADKLSNVGKGEIKSAFKEVLKQAGAEGIEEMFSETVSNIADNVVMGDKSRFNQLVKQYESQGFSPKEAVSIAWTKTIEEIAYSGLSGAISGGIHATPIAVFNKINKTYVDMPLINGYVDVSVIDFYNNVSNVVITNNGNRVNWNDLDFNQQTAIIGISNFAKNMGLNVTWVSDGAKRGMNGAFEISSNRLLIDVNAGKNKLNGGSYENAIIPTASHEMVHWAKIKSPEIYAKLKDFVLETFALQGINYETVHAERRSIMEKAHNDVVYTNEDVTEEVVARACEDILQNSNKFKSCLNTMNAMQQKTLLGKLTETFNNIKRWINNFSYEQYSNSNEAQIIRKDMSRFKKQINLYEKMIIDASINNNSRFRLGEHNNILNSQINANQTNINNIKYSDTNTDTLTEPQIYEYANSLKQKYNSNISENTIIDRLKTIVNKKDLLHNLQTYKVYDAGGSEIGSLNEVQQAIGKLSVEIAQAIEPVYDDYANEVLSFIKGDNLYLDRNQRIKIKHMYGSLTNYYKKVGIRLSSPKNPSLDEDWVALTNAWQYWSDGYPELFSSKTLAVDMPARLAEVMEFLNSQSLELDYDEQAQNIARELFDELYGLDYYEQNKETINCYVEYFAKLYREKLITSDKPSSGNVYDDFIIFKERLEAKRSSKNEYECFGWVLFNNILTKEQLQAILSSYADYQNKKQQFIATQFGETVVFLPEQHDILAYVKGPVINPIVTQIVQINNQDNNILKEIKDEILQNEEKQNIFALQTTQKNFGDDAITVFKPEDYKSYWDYQRWLSEKKKKPKKIKTEVVVDESVEEDDFDDEKPSNRQACFVKCTDEQAIANAQEMEYEGKKTIDIWRELKIFRGIFGDWVTTIPADGIMLYANGVLKTKSHTKNTRLKQTGNNIEGKLSDFLYWKQLYKKFPHFKDVSVLLTDAKYSYDTVKYLPRRNTIVIDKRLCYEFLEKKNRDLIAYILREVQRMIQIEEGKYIGKSRDYWVEQQQAGKLPFSKKLNRYLTADDMMKYFIDNYEAEAVFKMQIVSDLIYRTAHYAYPNFSEIVLISPDIEPDKALTFDENENLISVIEKDSIDGNNYFKDYKITEKYTKEPYKTEDEVYVDNEGDYFISFENRQNSLDKYSSGKYNKNSINKGENNNGEDTIFKTENGVLKENSIIEKDVNYDTKERLRDSDIRGQFKSANTQGRIRGLQETDDGVFGTRQENLERSKGILAVYNQGNYRGIELSKEQIKSLKSTAIKNEDETPKDGKQITEGENNNGEDTKLLERGAVPTVNRSRNGEWQHSINTAKIQTHLGYGFTNQRDYDLYVEPWETAWISKRDFKPAQKVGGGLEEDFFRGLRRVKLKNRDLKDRILSNDLVQKLSDTIFKTESGKVFSLYHWTPYKFDKFKYGDGAFHMGTLESALAVSHRTSEAADGVLKEVYVISKNPFILYDKGGFGAYNIAPQLENAGLLTYKKLLEISKLQGFYSDKYDAPANCYVREFLKTLGYDSYLYQNIYEDAGSWSVAVFDAEQIITVAENGVLKENSIIEKDVNYDTKEQLRDSDIRGQFKSANTQGRIGGLQETGDRVYRDNQKNWIESSSVYNQGNYRGLKLSKEQVKSLKSTAIKNEDETPKMVYHFTNNMDFEVFDKGDIGFHFGNKSQAKQRGIDLKQQGRIIAALLDIKNPIYINTDLMSWRPAHVAVKIYADGIISYEQYKNILKLYIERGYEYDSPASIELRKMLLDLGYDGIVYDNHYEGEGKSYIAFYPEQVIIIDDEKQITEGENYNGENTKLLERGAVPAANRRNNVLWQQSINSKIPKTELEISSGRNGLLYKEIRSGKSGWLDGKSNTTSPKVLETFYSSIYRRIRGIKLSGKDTIGRIVNPQILDRFKNTICKDGNGNLISLYHWTDESFEEFKKGEFGFHFGTLHAARDRYLQLKEYNPQISKGILKEVICNITNPIELKDYDVWAAGWVAIQLLEKGIISGQEYQYLMTLDGFYDNTYDNPAAEAVRDILAKNGYDGIIYENLSEDVGSYSLIALYPEQIITVAENGALKENSIIKKDVNYDTNERLRDNGKQITEGENYNGENTKLLERGAVPAVNRRNNILWQPGSNSATLAACLGMSKGSNDTYIQTIRAGECGWLVKESNSTSKETRKSFNRGVLRRIRGIKLSGKDTVGGIVSPQILEEFKDTICKDENGNLISLYHWTNENFEEFKKGEFGFHFGTLHAAHDRYLQSKEENSNVSKGFYKEVILNITNPIEINDEMGEWNANWVAFQLLQKGIIDEQQYNDLSKLSGFDEKTYDNPAAKAVRDILAQNGYDGIIYENLSEDVGSYSFIALYPEQIITVAENGILKDNSGISRAILQAQVADFLSPNSDLNKNDTKITIDKSDNISKENLDKFLYKKPIKLSKKDWVKVNTARTQKYMRYSEEDIPNIDVFRIAEYNQINIAYKYVVRNYNKYNFEIVSKKIIKPEASKLSLEEKYYDETAYKKDDSNGVRRGSDRNDSLSFGYGQAIRSNDELVEWGDKPNQRRVVNNGDSDSGRRIDGNYITKSNVVDKMNNIGIKEYDKFLYKKPIKLSKKDWAEVSTARTQKYMRYSEEDIPNIDVFRVAEYNKIDVANRYYIRNYDKYNFEVISKIRIKEEKNNVETTDTNVNSNGLRRGVDSSGSRFDEHGQAIRSDDKLVEWGDKPNQRRVVNNGDSDSRRRIDNSDIKTTSQTQIDDFLFKNNIIDVDEVIKALRSEDDHSSDGAVDSVNDFNYDDNDTNKGENYNGENTKLLERGAVPAVNRRNNLLWQPGSNSETLAECLGIYQNNNRIYDKRIWAGESNWLVKRAITTGEKTRKSFKESVYRRIRGVSLSGKDTIGGVVGQEILEKFKNTICKDENGNLISLYHWTAEVFEEFTKGEFGFHFGTLSAAKERYLQLKDDNPNISKGVYKEVILNITNPIEIIDENGIWTAGWVAFQIYQKGVITESEYERVRTMSGIEDLNYDNPAAKTVREILAQNGYDGIIYENLSEDVGSYSLIALYPEQIITVAENGVLKKNSGINRTILEGKTDLKYNESNIKEGENYGSKDTELLGRGAVPAAYTRDNILWESGTNSETLAAFLEISQGYNAAYGQPIRAGESDWICRKPNTARKNSAGFEQGVFRRIRGVKLSGKDTIGGIVSPKILERFKNTICKDENGNLISLYHWTNENFEEFKKGEFGFHFGTLHAAHDRYLQSKEENSNVSKGFYKEVILNITNPIKISDENLQWTTDWIAFQLLQKNIISDQEYDALSKTSGSYDNTYDNPAANAVRDILAQNGYDGIIYENLSEDVGSYSFIALYPEQIITVAENGVLKENIGINRATSQTQVASFNSDDSPYIQIDEAEVISGIRGKEKTFEFSQGYAESVLKSFGITKPGDYIHVQKRVMETLEREGYFTDKENRCTKVVNDASGMVVEINKSGIDETFNLHNYSRVGRNIKFLKLSVIRQLPEIIKYGELIKDDVKNAHEGTAINKKFAYIRHTISVDGKAITVQLDIKKSPQKNKFWVHKIIKNNSANSFPASNEIDAEAGQRTVDTINDDQNVISEKGHGTFNRTVKEYVANNIPDNVKAIESGLTITNTDGNSLSHNHLNVNVNNNKHNNGIDIDEFIKGLYGEDKEKAFEFSQGYAESVLKSFGITKPGDYIHVQKRVMETLEREGYFTDKENRCTKVVNDASGMVVEINKKGIKETFNLDNYARLGRFKKFAKLAVVRSLPKMIKSGNIVLHDVPNKYDDLANNKKFTYIECLTKIEGKDTVVKFAIKQSPQKNNFWVHSIYTIENVSDSPASIDSNTEAGHITADENSLSQNYLNVNVNNNKHNNGIDTDEFIKGLYGEDKEKAFEQGNVLQSTVDSVVDSDIILKYNDNSIKEGEIYAEDYQGTMGSLGREKREDDTRRTSGTTQENAETTREVGIAFQRRAKETYGDAGRLVFHLNIAVAYKVADVIDNNSQAGIAYNILKSKGYNVVYCDGAFELNDGIKTIEVTEAITLSDGTIYISSKSDSSVKDIVLHEVVHALQYGNKKEYTDYEDILYEEINFTSKSYEKLAKEINANHYGEKLDVYDISSFKYIIKELAAYISQYVCTNPKFAKEKFGGMFKNWENVVQAVYKMNNELGFDDVIKEATRTQVAFLNAYLSNKKEVVTPDPDAAQRPPMVTSETPPASPTSIDNISQSKNSVNGKYWGQKSNFDNEAITDIDIKNRRTPELITLIKHLSNGEDINIDEINTIPIIKKLERESDLKTSTHKNTSNERQKLRKEIIDNLLQRGSVVDSDGIVAYNGIVKQEYRADIVIGLPGSGKSSALAEPLSAFYLSRVIDSDIVKKMLPEYNGGIGASVVHKESVSINNAILQKAIEKGDNIVYQMIGGGKINSLINKIKMFKDGGYSVYLHLNELSSGKAIARSLNRYIEEGRFISPKVIEQYGDTPTQNFYTIINAEGNLDGIQENGEYRNNYSTDVFEGIRGKNEGYEISGTELGGTTETDEGRTFLSVRRGYVFGGVPRTDKESRVLRSTILGTKEESDISGKTRSLHSQPDGRRFLRLIDGYSHYSNDVKRGEAPKLINVSENVIEFVKQREKKVNGLFKTNIQKEATAQTQVAFFSSKTNKSDADDTSFLETGENSRKVKNFVASTLKTRAEQQAYRQNNIRAGNSGFISNKDINLNNPQFLNNGKISISSQDTIGRRLGINIQNRLNATIAKNSMGEPLSLYIINRYGENLLRYQQLGVLTGSVDMAVEKYNDENKHKNYITTGVCEEYYANITKPVILPFEPYELSVQEVGFYLTEISLLTSEQYFDLVGNYYSAQNAPQYNNLVSVKLRKILKSMGYDSIIYKNQNYDVGSLAIAVLDPDQLIPVAKNGILVGTPGIYDSNYTDHATNNTNASHNTNQMRLFIQNSMESGRKQKKQADKRITAGESGWFEEEYYKIAERIYNTPNIEYNPYVSEGNRLFNSKFIKEFSNTVFKDDNGLPLSFYIWSKKTISIDDTVNNMMYFKCFDNAFEDFIASKNKNATSYNGIFYEYKINSVSPLLLKLDDFDSLAIANILYNNGKISPNTYGKIYTNSSSNDTSLNKKAIKQLKNIIELLGYDSIIFADKKGKNTVMVFDEAQVVPIAENGIALNNAVILSSDLEKQTSDDNVGEMVIINSKGREIRDFNAIKAEILSISGNTHKLKQLTERLECTNKPVLQNANEINVGHSGVLDIKTQNIWSAKRNLDSLVSDSQKSTLSQYDTAGRSVPQKIREQFNNTIFKDSNGSLLSLFLWNKYGKNRHLHSAFAYTMGSLGFAADTYLAERQKHPNLKKGVYEEYYINAKNVYFMMQTPQHITARVIADDMYENGIISKGEYRVITSREGIDWHNRDNNAAKYLREVLKEKGIDAIAYMNTRYDTGSIGVIVLSEENLQLVSENGVAVVENGDDFESVEGYRRISVDKSNYLRNNLPKHYKDERVVGEKISQKHLDEILEFAQSQGVQIGSPNNPTGGFERYRGSMKILKELISEVSTQQESKLFINSKAKKPALYYDYVLGYNDDKSKIDVDAFAETTGRTITLNKFMFDDSKHLMREYSDAAKNGFFVKGTNYKHIIAHEIGHIINKNTKSLYIKTIATLEKIATKGDISLCEFIQKNISIYASHQKSGSGFGELISELNSLLQSNPNSDIIKLLKEEGVI